MMVEEITQCDIMPEIYPLLKDFENRTIQNQQLQAKVVNRTLQTSIDCLPMDDQDTTTRPVSEGQLPKTTSPY